MEGMSRGIYIMNILNILDKMRMLNILNTLEVRYSRYSRSKILMDSTLNILPLQVLYRSVYYGFTAYLHAGYVSFLFNPERGRDAAGSRKLARFLQHLGVEKGRKSIKNSLIMVIDNYAKSIYHNHDIQIPTFLRKKYNLQMINDLQGRFEKRLVTCNVQG